LSSLLDLILHIPLIWIFKINLFYIRLDSHDSLWDAIYINYIHYRIKSTIYDNTVLLITNQLFSILL
jgi:hypothetical protein